MLQIMCKMVTRISGFPIKSTCFISGGIGVVPDYTKESHAASNCANPTVRSVRIYPQPARCCRELVALFFKKYAIF